MTIKRRLAISNILMIVIPILLSLSFALLTLGIFWFAFIGNGALSSEGMQLQREATFDLAERAKQILALEDAAAQGEALAALEAELKEAGASLEIIQEGAVHHQLGASSPYGQLFSMTAASRMSIDGDTVQQVTEKIKVRDQTYYLFISRTLQDSVNGAFSIMGSVLIAVILGTIILTNRFLIRFVFRKIEGPLAILSGGVHEIRDGNLNHRIRYEGKDEFTPVCDDFNDMAAQLQASSALIQKQEQSRKELLAGISHDLRSPLTSIKAYAEGLLDGVARTPEARESYTRTIKTKAEEIDHMVSKLFLFSQMELDDYPYTPEALDLGEEVRAFAAAQEEELLREGLRLKVSPQEGPLPIEADPVQLRSVLANIIENSRKYKGQGAGTVKICARREDGVITLTVEDDGPGVPEEALPKLFDVFYRSDPARSRPQQGSGLGLAIAAKAIRRMGGSIAAENVVPHGLRIEMTFPVRGEEA